MTEKLTNQIAGILNETMRDNDALLRKLEDDKPTLDGLLAQCNGDNPHDGSQKPELLTVGFKRLTESATVPTRAYATDSGFDLYASEDVVIEPGETAVVPTGIALQLPTDMEAQVRPRSGVTSKTKLRVQLGTIDNDYRGDIGVIVDNIRYNPRDLGADRAPRSREILGIDGQIIRGESVQLQGMSLIRKGDRIAQLVVQYLPQVHAVEVDGDLTDTARGSGGFGSTGVRE